MLKAEGLEYEESGDGEAVLLIHGALIADAMLPLAREASLAERYRVIRYRRRGHGGSDPNPGAFCFEQTARDAAALLEHLGVERAHVVGHSGGGLIAVQLALQAPRFVHSLVLLEPAILPPDQAAAFLHSGLASVFEAYRSGDRGRAIDRFLELVDCGPGWRTEVANSVPGGAEQAERDCTTFFEVEVPELPAWLFDRECAARLTQPILYLVGGESGGMIEASRRNFQSLVPDAEHVTVPGLNHLLQMRDPKLVAAPIVDFLRRHPLAS